MVDAPTRTPLDAELTDHGRALAKALLGDVDLRPRPLPTIATQHGAAKALLRLEAPPVVVDRATSAARSASALPTGLHARPSVLPLLDDGDTSFGIDELWERTDDQARRGSLLLEWFVVIAVAFAVAFLVKTFMLQTFEIPSESMRPALDIGDRVVVNKLSYAIGGGIDRGDVVVFDRPAEARTGEAGEPDELIKRVIGLPGDTVEARKGRVFVNGREISETSYLSPGVLSYNFATPVKVPPGSVFVMGDNRGHSHDSRFFGPIPASTIVGRAMFIVWPFGRATGL